MLAGGSQHAAWRGGDLFLLERCCGVLVYERLLTCDEGPHRFSYLYVACLPMYMARRYTFTEYHQYPIQRLKGRGVFANDSV